MTVQLIANAHRQAAVDIVAPVAQLSVDAETVLAGSEIDARMWRSISYTVAVATNAVKWSVYGANDSAYADEQAVQALTNVAGGATGAYTVAQAPYAYYRVKIQPNVGGVQGTVTLRGIAKG
jgi:hypothetical protein